MLDILTFANTGAVGAMLLMVWKLMVKKDRASYQALRDMNEERKELYKNMEDLVKEVTIALVDKNHSDHSLAIAVEQLAEQLRDLKDKI